MNSGYRSTSVPVQDDTVGGDGRGGAHPDREQGSSLRQSGQDFQLFRLIPAR